MGAKQSTEKRALEVRVATWNLGNEVPTSGFPFLNCKDEPDIYAIGVQEAVYNPREGFIDMEMDLYLSLHREIGEDKYDNVWQQSLTPRTDKTYKSKEDFIAAFKAHPERMSMSGIRIIIFAKKSLAAEGFGLENIEVNVQTCGRLDGISGNKGAISITCTIGDCWVSFLTGHLNAHTEELERRITDMESIMFGLHTFEGEFADSDDYVSSETIGAQYEQYVKNIEVANRSHVVITFGDFNFRLEPLGDDGQPLEHDEQCIAVENAVEVRQWDELASFDQLLREQAKRRCFYQFTEMGRHPKWAPTFKLNKKDGVQPSKYNLKRCPSWCDRILLKLGHGGKCTQTRYVAHHDYEPNTSDHVPVTADFTLNVWRTLTHKQHLHFHMNLNPSKMFRAASMPKKRTIVLENIRLCPDHKFALAVFEDVIEEGEPIDALESASLIVSLYHSASPEREKTKAILYDSKEMRWSDSLTLGARASVADLVQFPLVLCVRNVQAEQARLHRQGEAMLDLRELYDSAAKGDPKAKYPLSGSHRVEIIQRGTPRGVIQFDYTFSKVK